MWWSMGLKLPESALVPTFGKPCASKGGGVLKLILVHHVSPLIRHGVEFRGIPVDTCRHSSE